MRDKKLWRLVRRRTRDDCPACRGTKNRVVDGGDKMRKKFHRIQVGCMECGTMYFKSS